MKKLNKATYLLPISKKKSRKQQLDDGGQMDYNQKQQQSRQGAQKAAGAIPVWGQLAGATMSVSDGIRGDSMNGGANALANVISPTSGIRNAYDTGHSEDILVTALNPIGGGILASKRAKEDQARKQAQLDGLTTRRLIDNSGGAFARGGTISNYPKLVKGGSLKQISPDAVEVKGNNPGVTDGVELDNAFVDNNEIIDRENRVFSDSVAIKGGKSVAAVAKRLEKMKNGTPRFQKSNEHIDRKLDDLFQYQEKTKSFDSQNGTMKRGYANGGVYKYQAQDFSNEAGQVWKDPAYETSTSEGTGSGFNWQGAANTAATYTPNIVSALQQSRLKGPSTPQLENSVRLSRIGANDQLGEATRQYRLAQGVVNKNTSQGSNLAAATGSLLARRFANQNQIYGEVNRQNAVIANQEAGLNMMVGARNSERRNQYTQGQNDFYNRKLALTTENVANASNKFQAQNREKNEMERDRQGLKYLYGAYGDSGVLSRLDASDPELADSVRRSLGVKSKNKMGGRLSKLYKGKC